MWNTKWNTIRLLKGEANLTKQELSNFSAGDTIHGIDSEAQELARWSIDDEDAAMEALSQYKCKYYNGLIEEYALEYCSCDEDGDFIEGSDYEMAETSRYTESQKKAIYKYSADKVKVQILVTPEQRERYKALADSRGVSLTKLIIDLLEENC